MDPRVNLHLNSKQSAQFAAVILGVALVRTIVNNVDLPKKRKLIEKNAFDEILVEKDPKTGMVTLLSLRKDGTAMQYKWTERNRI